MNFELTTKPECEPVSIDDVRDHLKISHDLEDFLLDRLIKTAREYVESYIKQPLVTQTWTAYLDEFSSEPICLKANLQSINSVLYIDENGVQHTLDSSVYSINTKMVIGTVYPGYNQSWPSARCIPNAVEIEFIAGFGLADSVPNGIRSAILLMVGHWYKNREQTTNKNTVVEIPMGAKSLLDPHRLFTC